MKQNAFFKYDDPQVNELAGFRLDPAWWSRPYEYAFAMKFAAAGLRVADMGCGWMPRPLKDGLAQVCEKVYAVDADARLLEQKSVPANLEFMVADFAVSVPIEPESLDRVFCVSVLEDLGDLVSGALKTFAQVLKPDGLMALTFDVQYDMGQPLGPYPGVKWKKFADAVDAAHLAFLEEPDFDLSNAVNHKEFNLTPFHCALVKQQ